MTQIEAQQIREALANWTEVIIKEQGYPAIVISMQENKDNDQVPLLTINPGLSVEKVKQLLRVTLDLLRQGNYDVTPGQPITK